MGSILVIGVHLGAFYFIAMYLLLGTFGFWEYVSFLVYVWLLGCMILLGNVKLLGCISLFWSIWLAFYVFVCPVVWVRLVFGGRLVVWRKVWVPLVGEVLVFVWLLGCCWLFWYVLFGA